MLRVGDVHIRRLFEWHFVNMLSRVDAYEGISPTRSRKLSTRWVTSKRAAFLNAAYHTLCDHRMAFASRLAVAPLLWV